jgi:hypothetical protein
VFHGTDKDDVEQHWFTCEAIWSVKRITDEASKIAQPETTFRDRTLTWYMKCKATAIARQMRSRTKSREICLRKSISLNQNLNALQRLRRLNKKTERLSRIMTNGSRSCWIG